MIARYPSPRSHLVVLPDNKSVTHPSTGEMLGSYLIEADELSKDFNPDFERNEEGHIL